MKKIVLFFAVIVAVSFVSCGQKQEATTEDGAATKEIVVTDECCATADPIVVNAE